MKRGEIMHIRILGVIPAAALTLTACGAGAVRDDLRSSAASPLLSHIQEAFDFNGLPQMVATSSAVVLGHVISVKPGPVTGGTYPDQMEASGAHEGDGAVQYATATIAIENVLYGRPAISLGSQGWTFSSFLRGNFRNPSREIEVSSSFLRTPVTALTESSTPRANCWLIPPGSSQPRERSLTHGRPRC
jgi:hypothetical protein